jgi:hypothetical protein
VRYELVIKYSGGNAKRKKKKITKYHENRDGKGTILKVVDK